MTGGWPMSARTSATPCTTEAIALPTNVTRLPDTNPPIVGRPGVEDLASPTQVLSQVERDEKRLREGPFTRMVVRSDTVHDDGGHGRNAHRRARVRWGCRRAEQGRCPPNRGLIGNEEVESLPGTKRKRRAIGCRGGGIRQGPSRFADIVESEPKWLRQRRFAGAGQVGEQGAPGRPSVGNPPEQVRVQNCVRTVRQSTAPECCQGLGDGAWRPSKLTCQLSHSDRAIWAHQDRRRHFKAGLAAECIGALSTQPDGLDICVDHESIAPDRQASAEIQVAATFRGQDLACGFGDSVRDYQHGVAFWASVREKPRRDIVGDERPMLHADSGRYAIGVQHKIDTSSGRAFERPYLDPQLRERIDQKALHVGVHDSRVPDVRCSVNTEQRTVRYERHSQKPRSCGIGRWVREFDAA